MKVNKTLGMGKFSHPVGQTLGPVNNGLVFYFYYILIAFNQVEDCVRSCTWQLIKV
jgi:hypothetical protein